MSSRFDREWQDELKAGKSDDRDFIWSHKKMVPMDCLGDMRRTRHPRRKHQGRAGLKANGNSSLVISHRKND